MAKVSKTVMECKICGTTWKFRGCACGDKKRCQNPNCRSKRTKTIGRIQE